MLLFGSSTTAPEQLTNQKKYKATAHTNPSSGYSVLHMSDRLYEQQQAATTTLCLFGRNNMCLNDGEWSHISQATEVLGPFEEATKEVSAEQYVTISKVIPLVSLLQQATSSAGQRSNTLASQLEAQCKRRFQNVKHNHTSAVSIFLDIRFKNIVFCDSGNVETIKSRIITEIQALACSERQATGCEVSVKSTLRGVTQSVQRPGDYHRLRCFRAIAQQTQMHILKCEDTWKKK